MSFINQVDRISRENFSLLSGERIGSLLPAEVESDADCLAVMRNRDTKDAIVVSTLGVRVLRLRTFGFDGVEFSADYDEIVHVDLMASRRNTVVVYSLVVDTLENGQGHYVVGAGAEHHGYYGAVDRSGVEAVEWIGRQLVDAAQAGLKRHRALNPPSAFPATTRVQAAFDRSIVGRLRRDSMAGIPGDMVFHEHVLAGAMSVVIETLGADLRPHQEYVLSLFDFLATALSSTALTMDDIAAVMGVPDEPDPSASPAEGLSFGLSSSATSAFIFSKAVRGETGDNNFMIWQELSDMSTEFAAWFSIAIVRLEDARLI